MPAGKIALEPTDRVTATGSVSDDDNYVFAGAFRGKNYNIKLSPFGFGEASGSGQNTLYEAN